MKHSLKEIVKGTVAKMSYVCNGIVYYTINVEGTLYQLEMDATDKEEFNNVYFYPDIPAIQLMRWIGKYTDTEKFIQLTNL
jgi:hypothetical protein